MSLSELYTRLIEKIVAESGLTSSELIVPKSRNPNDEGPSNVLGQLAPSGASRTELSASPTFVDQLENELDSCRDKSFFIIGSPWIEHRSLNKEFREEFSGNNIHEIVLCAAVENAPTGSWIFAEVPAHSLSRRGGSEFRETIVEATRPQIILTYEHPYQLFFDRARATSTTAFVGLEIGEASDVPTRFFRVPDSVTSKKTKKVIEDFEQLWRRGGGATDFGLIHRGELAPSRGFNQFLYSRKRQEILSEIEKVGETESLGSLVDFRVATHPFGDEGLDNELDMTEECVLTARAIARKEDWTDELKTPSDQLEPVRLENRDLCLPQIFRLKQDEGLPVFQITGETLGRQEKLYAGHGVLVLRPKEELSDEETELLSSYLQSRWAAELLTGAPSFKETVRLSVSLLSELAVPRASKSILTSWRGLRRAKQYFQDRMEEAGTAYSNLFEAASLGKSANELLTAGERLREKMIASRKIDDLSYRVRNQFPYPLAYLWRKVETAAPESLEGYKILLEAAEATLCYLACIAMTSIRTTPEEIRTVEEVATKLSQTSKGTAMGDWQQILQEVNSERIRDVEGAAACPEVFWCFDKEVVEGAVHTLKEMRVNQAHRRGPKGAAIPEAYKEGFRALKTLYSGIDFLTQYQLRKVTSTERDTFEQKTHYAYRDLTGDHPLARRSKGVATTPEVEAGSLYFADRDDELHLLRPYLTRRNCPECERPATFFLDKFDPDSGRCRLQSLEHGHTQSDLEITEAFRHVGFLPGG